MGGAIVGPQRRIETDAGAVPYVAQKAPTDALIGPVRDQADSPSTGQVEAVNAQGVGRSMLATPTILAVVDVAVGETADILDPRQRLAIDTQGYRLQRAALE